MASGDAICCLVCQGFACLCCWMYPIVLLLTLTSILHVISLDVARIMYTSFIYSAAKADKKHDSTVFNLAIINPFAPVEDWGQQ